MSLLQELKIHHSHRQTHLLLHLLPAAMDIQINR